MQILKPIHTNKATIMQILKQIHTKMNYHSKFMVICKFIAKLITIANA